MTFEWRRPEPEPEPKPKPKPDQLDTAPVDSGVVIQSLITSPIAEERRFNCSDAVVGCRMVTREQLKVGIQIVARVAALRRLAERTARDYEADVATDNSLPAEHRRLRRTLFAIAVARRRRKGAR
jgi:hypothetical protein